MKDYLLRYAIDNIWCNPRQDKQYSYKLRRLTPFDGVRNSYVIEKERYTLPKVDLVDVWHIYQIGRIIPNLIGFPSVKNKWMPLTYLLEQHLVDCEVYVTNGVQFSRNETFVLITENRNLLVAIKHNTLFPRLDLPAEDPDVYLHMYSNGYFRSTRSNGNRYVKVLARRALTLEDIRQFQILSTDTAAALGYVGKYFVNGRMVSGISVSTAEVGDHLEFIIDSSVKRILYLKVSELKGFVSTLDNVGKYILHYPGKTETIDYIDDLDIYLIKPRANNPSIYSGVLYHQNKGTWARQLTHKDYSIPVDSVQAFVAEHPEDPRYTGPGSKWPSDLWNNVSELTVKVIVRHGGYERPLVADVGRIQELYKLSSDNILRAMTGADSVAECWLAENLEKTHYVGFMGLTDIKVFPEGFGLDNQPYPNKEYVREYAAQALGYHSAAKLLSNSPLKVIPDAVGINHVTLTFNHWDDSTMFEYNLDGELLGHYHHLFGEVYYPKNSDCYMVEPVVGKGSNTISGFYGKRTVDIPKGHGYRLYAASLSTGADKGIWKDITDGDLSTFGYLDETDFENVKWVWTHNVTHWDVYIRTDAKFYLKEMSFTKTSGMIRFALDAFEDVEGEIVNKTLDIPFGQIDVFLNNKPIIEGVDYISGDLRTVVNNLEYLVDGTNTLLIRGSGFCDSDLNRFKAVDEGFIEYGVMSSNRRHDLHHNKVQRIVADGKLLHPEDVIFDEELSDFVMPNVRNGAPYQITTPQTTFREIFIDDLDAKLKDDAIDKQVSDYLTFYLPKRERSTVDSINRKYMVFSAGSNLMLHLIMSKRLIPPVVNGRLDEDKIKEMVKPYEWIKELDVANTEYNKNHMYVYPHWFPESVGLEWFEYKMYRYILKLFLRTEIDTASFVYIKRTQ